MALNELKKEVAKFEKKVGFDKTKSSELLKMLQKELTILKKAKNKKVKDHQLIDIQVLLLQLANRYKTNLNLEWKKQWNKKQKYKK
ncbi:hypothetical protein HOC80_04805 [archaeon]|jgi:hypothetical protein|nr:hypothetical protein [archaeon]MBT4417393.1 hypothetical protein [archaeon]